MTKGMLPECGFALLLKMYPLHTQKKILNAEIFMLRLMREQACASR